MWFYIHTGLSVRFALKLEVIPQKRQFLKKKKKIRPKSTKFGHSMSNWCRIRHTKLCVDICNGFGFILENQEGADSAPPPSGRGLMKISHRCNYGWLLVHAFRLPVQIVSALNSHYVLSLRLLIVMYFIFSISFVFSYVIHDITWLALMDIPWVSYFGLFISTDHNSMLLTS